MRELTHIICCVEDLLNPFLLMCLQLFKYGIISLRKSINLVFSILTNQISKHNGLYFCVAVAGVVVPIESEIVRHALVVWC